MALKLKANPTFWTKVEIPVHGGGKEEFSVEFVHKTREQLEAWQSEETDPPKSNSEKLLEIVKAWKGIDGDPPLNAEVLDQLQEQYQGFTRFVAKRYVEELMQVRLGN